MNVTDIQGTPKQLKVSMLAKFPKTLNNNPKQVHSNIERLKHFYLQIIINHFYQRSSRTEIFKFMNMIKNRFEKRKSLYFSIRVTEKRFNSYNKTELVSCKLT